MLRRRQGEAASALTMLASFCDLRSVGAKADAAWLFDFVQLQYPSSLADRTVADDRVRDVYLDLVRRDVGSHERWLQHVRSEEDRAYYRRFVRPALRLLEDT